MHILFLPFWQWYPNPGHPAQGISVREQARAVSAFHRVTVLCCEHSESKPGSKSSPTRLIPAFSAPATAGPRLPAG